MTTSLVVFAALAGLGGLALGAYALIRTRAVLGDCRALVHRLLPDGSGLDARAVRDVAVVRYDALEEMSGARSFSLALLNASGDGVVVTSINGRTESRTYAKTIQQGRAAEALSPEEYRAIRSARLGQAPGDPLGDEPTTVAPAPRSGNDGPERKGDRPPEGAEGVSAGERPTVSAKSDGTGTPGQDAKESTESKEATGATRSPRAKASTAAKGAEDAKETRSARGARGAKNAKDAKGATGPEETQGEQTPQKAQESPDSQEAEGAREAQAAKTAEAQSASANTGGNAGTDSASVRPLGATSRGPSSSTTD